MKEEKEKSLKISLAEESWEQLSAMANAQQRSLEGLIEEAITAYLQEQPEEASDEKIDPIKDTKTAKSWGYNSDVRGK